MKKLIMTLALTATCVSAFAQGKVTFVNDSLHAYYMGTSVLEADKALVGNRTPLSGLLPSGASLRADLYAGTSAGNLSLISSTTMSGSIAGRQNTMNVDLPAPIIGGVAQYFQVQVRSSLFATTDLSWEAGNYGGKSAVFTVVPNSPPSPAYNSVVNHASPALSTWANGTFVLPATTTLGSIEVYVIPEPSTFALAGLGAAAMLIFRRRK